MDQVKIGKFIADRRKNANYTQMQLAEKLGITDRAISKWETGKSLPDSSIMLQLCSLLDITVNDLLSGEVVTMDQYNKELEKDVLKYLADSSLLKEDTKIIVEASVETNFDYVEEFGFEITKYKKYKTNVHVFLRRK